MSFWSELKRRNVVKVAIAYLIVAWLIVQIVSIIFPMFHMPEWTGIFVTVLLIIGFPIVLIFAWAFEITPEGLKRTHEVPHHESITHLTGQKLNYIVTGLLVVAVGYILLDNLYLDRRIIKADSPKTIAVLPFENMSPDPDQEYFVDGLSEELLNSLAQIPDLTVIARTSSFSFKGTTKKIPEIADELGVAHILEGSVRKSGDDLRITAQLVKGADGSHLWSNTYDRELKDIFEVQEDIAKAVANELKATLGIGKTYKQIGGTDNEKAYELYLTSRGRFNEYGMEQALESINAAIALDPEFALAWATKAQIHIAFTPVMPANTVPLELEKCLQAVQRAIEIEPNLAEAYAVMGNYRWANGDWIEAEFSYRKALELSTEPFLRLGNYEYLLFTVGYFKKANQYLEVVLKNDPLNQFFIGHYSESFGFLGDMQKLEEALQPLYEILGKDIFDRVSIPFRLRLESLDDVRLLLPSDFKLKEGIKTSKDALEELKRMSINDDFPAGDGASIWISAACLGDLDFAMDWLEKESKMDASGVCNIWLPVMHGVRQTPRFKEFIKEIGLVDYWEKFGWPDICYKLDNGDFVCD